MRRHRGVGRVVGVCVWHGGRLLAVHHERRAKRVASQLTGSVSGKVRVKLLVEVFFHGALVAKGRFALDPIAPAPQRVCAAGFNRFDRGTHTRHWQGRHAGTRPAGIGRAIATNAGARGTMQRLQHVCRMQCMRALRTHGHEIRWPSTAARLVFCCSRPCVGPRRACTQPSRPPPPCHRKATHQFRQHAGGVPKYILRPPKPLPTPLPARC